jgi:hypothetical protein
MDTRRKIQFGAAAVFANGILALAVLSPRVAQANPCSSFALCTGTCSQNLAAVCNHYAPAGCTATSETCMFALDHPCQAPTSYLLGCNFS